MNSKVIKGAAIIGVAGVIVKILGAFFRIPLTNWLGADGMAYYGYAYTIYGALVVLATAGLPVAISRLVSENIAVKQYRNAHKVFHVSMIMMFLLGAGLFLICFLGAKHEPYGNIRNNRAACENYKRTIVSIYATT